jgi:hypothetical protein
MIGKVDLSERTGSLDRSPNRSYLRCITRRRKMGAWTRSAQGLVHGVELSALVWLAALLLLR